MQNQPTSLNPIGYFETYSVSHNVYVVYRLFFFFYCTVEDSVSGPKTRWPSMPIFTRFACAKNLTFGALCTLLNKIVALGVTISTSHS